MCPDVLADSESVALASSLWAFDASFGTPASCCARPDESGSTVARNGDELVFDLAQVASSARVRASPSRGRSTCAAHAATLRRRAAGRSRHDVSMPAANLQALGRAVVRFEDGSLLVYQLSADATAVAWGLLLTAPRQRVDGEVFCSGLATTQPSSLTLGDFSRLGSCPRAVPSL